MIDKIKGLSGSFLNWCGYPINRIRSNKLIPYSRLIIKSDDANWVLNSIAEEMNNICNSIGIETVDSDYWPKMRNQCVFFTSKYDVLVRWKKNNNRIALPYYHGDPNTHPIFKIMINNLKKHHREIARIQVSHSHVENIILNTGIIRSKVFRIPISIDLDLFPLVNGTGCSRSRKQLNIPEFATVIGSFQKDGNGWGEGNQPKLIKGPDIFLQTIKILKDDIPNLHVLLTGPARGYVKNGLKALGIPFHHHFLNDYSEISKYYHALDLYMITSREEGGPRAVLESMASGIPLVSTRVGQAMDLVDHDKNGWLVDIEDVEALSYWVKYVIENSNSLDDIKSAARKTAEDNCYEAQIPLWKNFMDGFVNY